MDKETGQGMGEVKEGNGGEASKRLTGSIHINDGEGLEHRPLTKGEKEMREARRRYVLAYLRCARAAVDEIGKLLADSHIDEDAALEMMAEVKELYF